jgi:hypothetical protein
MVHLVARVLREFHVEPVFAQTQDLHTVRTECLGYLHAQLGWPATADIQHHHGHRFGFLSRRCDAPNATVAQFAYRDADATYVHRHHFRVRLAHARGEKSLLRYREMLIRIKLKIWHELNHPKVELVKAPGQSTAALLRRR